MTFLFKINITIFLTISLAACDGPFNDYSNYDLSQAYNKCTTSELSAAGIQRCNNIKKECAKRKRDSGFRC